MVTKMIICDVCQSTLCGPYFYRASSPAPALLKKDLTRYNYYFHDTRYPYSDDSDQSNLNGVAGGANLYWYWELASVCHVVPLPAEG